MGEAAVFMFLWISFVTTSKLKKKVTLQKQQEGGPYLKQAFSSESMVQEISG